MNSLLIIASSDVTFISCLNSFIPAFKGEKNIKNPTAGKMTRCLQIIADSFDNQQDSILFSHKGYRLKAKCMLFFSHLSALISFLPRA